MFFEDIHNMLQKAAKLDAGKALVFSVDQTVKDLIVDLNTKQQLGRDGIDSDGDSLGEYADFTVQARNELGLQTDHIDFKVTGDYWKSWTVTVDEQAITITTNQDRFEELVNDLGFDPGHVGLTDENISLLTEKLLIGYQGYVLNELQL